MSVFDRCANGSATRMKSNKIAAFENGSVSHSQLPDSQVLRRTVSQPQNRSVSAVNLRPKSAGSTPHIMRRYVWQI